MADIFDAGPTSTSPPRPPATRRLDPKRPRFSLPDAWVAIREGRARVVDCAPAHESSALILELRPSANRPLDARSATVLERILSGESQKSCALELKLSQSMITGIARDALRRIGVTCRPSRVPLPLTMIAYAFRKELSSSWVSALELEAEAGERILIRVPPLVTRLTPFLTEAERAVATLLIEGKSYLEIAKVRKTSQRTVANQIASLFRRLHISGRAELVLLLLEQANASVVCGREAHPSLAGDDERRRSQVTARFGARCRSWSSINGSITPSVNPALFADRTGASCT